MARIIITGAGFNGVGEFEAWGVRSWGCRTYVSHAAVGQAPISWW